MEAQKPLENKVIRFLLTIVIFGLLAAPPAPLAETQTIYRVEDVDALDGDTVVLTAIGIATAKLPGEPLEVELRRPGLKVRLSGINTPESFRSKCPEEKRMGLEAKKWLQDHIDSAQKLELVTGKREKGKFGRVLGRLLADGFDLNQGLIDAGLADAYFGGRRDPMRWCGVQS